MTFEGFFQPNDSIKLLEENNMQSYWDRGGGRQRGKKNVKKEIETSIFK